MRPAKMTKTKSPVNFVARVNPAATPTANSHPGDGWAWYSQSRYIVRKMKRLVGKSVVTNPAWAIRFGSKAARPPANTAGQAPHRRYVHQPTSATKAAPRKRLGNRATRNMSSADTEER